MDVISLQSGSNGNCVYVEAAGVRLLFDAGISGKSACERLAARGRDIRQVDAVLISHDHADHSSCLGVLHRKFGLPVYATKKTYGAAGRWRNLGEVSDVRHFEAGDVLRFGAVQVHTVRTPHDGADGVAFVVDDGRRRLGILTDLGHVFNGLKSLVASLDAVLLESNYDPRMLAEGDYPYHVQARIRGPQGHLSNEEACQLLDAADRRLQWVCLGHISQSNNTPQRVVAVHRKAHGERFPLHLARRDAVGDVLQL